MPKFSFAISQGSDVASPVNIETVVTDAPTVLPDQLAAYLGPVKRRTLDGAVQRNGSIPHRWFWDYMSRADFNLLLTTIFDNPGVASKAVTITTLDELGSYATFNATVDRPVPGEDYTLSIGIGAGIRDLVLTFRDLVAAGSGFLLNTDDALILNTDDTAIVGS